MTRRDFIAASAAFASTASFASGNKEEIRAALLHWGANMWGAPIPKSVTGFPGKIRRCRDKVEFSEKMWRDAIDRMVQLKMNLVLIDLGEFPIYPSHPELALPGSRSPEWIRAEVKRLKSLGLEPIPKLNFSAAHDAWLGEYSMMVSTRKYYEVCRDVIRDTAEMFGSPRFLHIGYDEEKPKHQSGHICVRTGELWWHDFNYFVKTVEGAGMRPWMWSDYGWEHEEFVENCPKCVMHSNWYYDGMDEGFDLSKMSADSFSRKRLELFMKLDKAGFEQIPCGTNWCSSYRRKHNLTNDKCLSGLVKFCRENISAANLKGFLVASWPGPEDNPKNRDLLFNGLGQLSEAMDKG